MELIVGHEKSSSRERAQAIASAEKELSDLFHHAERDYEARLMSQVIFLSVAAVFSCRDDTLKVLINQSVIACSVML